MRTKPSSFRMLTGWFYRVAFAAVLIGLLAADVLLYRQNVALKARVGAPIHSLLPPIGRNVPPLRETDPSGRPLAVRFNDPTRQTLLFAFSEQCQICSLTWPTWRDILGKLDRNRFRPVFVNVAPGLGPAEAAGLGIASYPVFGQLDPKIIAAYNIQLTPEVVEISPGGMVEAAWLGALDPKTLSGLELATGIAGVRPYLGPPTP